MVQKTELPWMRISGELSSQLGQEQPFTSDQLGP
jgi:hypothetical protein